MRWNSTSSTETARLYQLVELAVPRQIDGQSWLGVWSGGEFFPIGLEC
ncbi:hypothetical protein [Pseudomonas sp. GL-RE-26]